MLRKILFVLGLVALMSGYVYAQNATIKGKVTEMDGKTPIEFATVRLLQGGNLVLGVVTDERGNYTLSPVASGKYDLVVTYVGYQDHIIQGYEISGNATKIEDISLGSKDQILEAVVITAERPIFEPGQVTSEQRISSEEIELMAGKSIDNILATMSGVTTSSGGTSFRGNRPGSATYIVDGIESTIAPPRTGWSGFALIQGAVPAEYASDAVIEIEMKGYTPVHHGSVEVTGSVDGFNDFSMVFYLTGPIAKRQDGSVLLGYALSGSGGYGSGGAIRGGSYRASQETIDYLVANPYRNIVGGTTSSQVTSNLNYVTKYQEGEILSLEEKKRRRVQNAWSASGALSGKIDIKASNNFDIMLRGDISYSKGKSWDFSNSLFNSINNGMSESLVWDVNARITHRIKTDPNSIVKNVFYRLYGYYYQGRSKSYSDRHKDNLFDYGYIGTFEHDMGNYYALENVEYEGQERTVNVLQTYYVTGVTFTPSDKNPELAEYTKNALARAGSFTNDDVIRTYGGLLNGISFASSPAYGLFTAPGIPYNGYAHSFSDRVAAKAAFSFDIGDHSIKFGFDFEQSISRSHSISPIGLWQIMRNVTNRHIQDLNDSLPNYHTDENDRFTDTIDYPRLVNQTAQSKFDSKLRDLLGVDATEWIDIDAIEPSYYTKNGGLALFGPEDLFNDGNSIISYYGYNYTGDKTLNTPITMSNMKEWFSGGSTYPDFSNIGAYKPLRISAYIQDKFAIKSLFFDLGIRVDVFDRNQPYVKDMYLYSDAYTVGEALNEGKISSGINLPDFIKKDPDNYYIYVTDINGEISDESITAYRSGKVWYDPLGREVTDPNSLVKSGSPELLPLLKESPGDKDITQVRWDAFDDYTPTFENGGISLSPRIAFAFTVAENSKFTASYNVITKSLNQRLDPLVYLYYSTYSTSSESSPLPNPGLKPEKNINYEIGFEQAISKKMKISFTAYYSEKRDQVQVYHFSQAYPSSYYSYTNMDFGTTQGFILGMELRRTQNLSFTTSYTLQFAKGTGSSESSSLALIASGAPNLRTLTVLSFDQRHKINFNLMYQFFDGPNYNGPITRKEIKSTGRIREIKWLQLSGVSLTFAASSGLPYTASSEPYSSIVSGQGRRLVKGSIYGSRMPWMFNCDLNIWKGFPVVLKKSDVPRERKTGNILVSLAILDLLELDEIMSVYPYTGSATDDGFLTASQFQQYIASQENLASFTDYYTIRMEGINRLGAPRRFNLSVRFEF
jgi:outer membrane receptor for ferrienterochelin and colicin